MRSVFAIAVLGVAALFATGCGKPAAESPSATGVATADAVVGAPEGQAIAKPIATARSFLEAVQRGETAKAAAMLTPLALKTTSENDLSFSPPGSATAQFNIVGAEMVDAEKAVVETVWSDLDADGNRTEESIAWALRLTDGQWRISGMAAEIAADQPPLVIDFENPVGLVEQNQPQTPKTAPATMPQPTNPADQIARDPFQQPATR